MKVAIVGAGGLGATFGALLTAAGIDVTMIEIDRRRVEKIGTEGLDMIMPDGTKKHFTLKITDDVHAVGEVDLVQISVKGYHTASAAASVVPLVGPRTYVLSVQNGLGNLRRIAEHVPAAQVIGGVTALSAMPLDLNLIKFNGGHGGVAFGRFDGVEDPGLQDVARMFEVAGIEAQVISGNVQVPIWRKLIANVSNNCVAAITGFTGNQMLACEPICDLIAKLAEEVALVARAEGLDFDELNDPAGFVLHKTLPGVKDNKISMLQDVEAGRRTEIETLNAEIVRLGAVHGIPTPYNHTMTCLVHAREQQMLWDQHQRTSAKD
ncbi:MAG: 2-dehydropantoate 2-reductase [Deltaproteobacteria bacterium]|nr:2-dehydropantoate 2-reductase [Candidatus Anaeroferrophillus wilburensis]MBN2889126.1 2-dehydropantoate 2-reductase [Deltaproteobacteria bacterium]